MADFQMVRVRIRCTHTTLQVSRQVCKNNESSLKTLSRRFQTISISTKHLWYPGIYTKRA